jgi:hypothetical protein
MGITESVPALLDIPSYSRSNGAPRRLGSASRQARPLFPGCLAIIETHSNNRFQKPQNPYNPVKAICVPFSPALKMPGFSTDYERAERAKRQLNDDR